MATQKARKLIRKIPILYQCKFNEWILSLHDQIIYKVD